MTDFILIFQQYVLVTEEKRILDGNMRKRTGKKEFLGFTSAFM